MAEEHLQELPAQEILECYRWEIRKVTREGFISFDGIRHGVPWQYSGKEVHVRLYNAEIEIYYGAVLVSKHTVQYRSGRILWFPGQYQGLAEHNGIAVPFPAAIQQDIQVEARGLDFYDRLSGDAFYVFTKIIPTFNF